LYCIVLYCIVLFGWQEWMEQAYLGGTGVDIPAV
jgi:hypothetical protein